MQLYDWQQPLADQALASLSDHRFFINACTTGAGKTYMCCDVMRRLKVPHLIIAPKVALTQWRRVIEDFGLKEYVLDVINPEQISKPSGCKWYTRDKLWQIPENTCVVFDEIHRGASGIYEPPRGTVKKAKSITTRAVAELKAFPGARLHAMSATPACDPLHLQALGFWGGLHAFNKANFTAWCRENGCEDGLVKIFAGYDDINNAPIFRYQKNFKFTQDKKKAEMHMKNIRKAFGPRFMALGPEDIPGFPEQLVAVKTVDLNKRDRDEIDKAYNAMSERLRSKAQGLAASGRERERIEFIMAEVLAELTANAIEDGNSVVNFFNFTEPRMRFVKQLRKRLPSLGISQIYGAQKEDRQKEIDLFQQNVNHSMVANLQAGGAAVSLHDDRHERMRVSFMLPSNNAAEIVQGFGRTRRANGTFARQYFVIAAGTIQERVKMNLDKKLRNLDALTDNDLLP